METQPGPISLSVIVPVLNEAGLLPGLFANLAGQQGVVFELILSDGGSTDETLPLARRLAVDAPFVCRIHEGRAGRGRQMNAGARFSNGGTLLFLHVDSIFSGTDVLAEGLSVLDREAANSGNERIAGHFALRFQREDNQPSLAFYFYEAKAALDRSGCIHGDQGFMLRKSFFQQLGGFETSLGFLEDDRLAAKVRRLGGQWILLPGPLFTSARRFETEGFFPRQALNAMILALEDAEREDFLKCLPEIYRRQQPGLRLQLAPFLVKIRKLLLTLDRRQRFRLWNRVGRFLVQNLWQVLFFLDVRKGFRQSIPAEHLPSKIVDKWEGRCRVFLDNSGGHALAGAFAWVWFHGLRIFLQWSSFFRKQIQAQR